MKALIVDDEKHVRDAIRLLVDWQSHGIDIILEAADGQSAIACMCREQPEIVMTDMMMPVKNGVELLEWLHHEQPGVKTIVISGHDDFSLVRHTVKYGGTDYILKPIDAAQLNEALHKAVQAWSKEEEARSLQRERSIEINQIKPVYLEKLLSNLIDEPAQYSESATELLHREIGLPPAPGSCRAAILSLDTMDRGLKHKFMHNSDLLFFSLINICNEFLKAGRRGFAFRYWNSENEIVLLLWDGGENAEALLGRVNDGLQQTLRCRVDFGLGSLLPFPAALSQSYQEARTALRQRNLLVRKAWIHTLAEGAAGTTAKARHLADHEERLRLALRSGSQQQLQTELQHWFDGLKELDAITYEQLEHWRHEYAVMSRRWLQEMLPAEALKETEGFAFGEAAAGRAAPLNEQGLLSLSVWQQELAGSLLRLSKLMLERQQQGGSVIAEIAKYIEAHYHEDITLQNIAGRFFLSREYISRRFKQEFAENLSDYLGRIRIEKAKLLLLNPHFRISQVAEMVGYRDEKYFSKVFKKLEGLSPNEYRKKL